MLRAVRDCRIRGRTLASLLAVVLLCGCKESREASAGLDQPSAVERDDALDGGPQGAKSIQGDDARGLARSDDVAHLRTVITAPPEERSPEARVTAAKRLGDLADFEVVDQLIDMMDDDDRDVRAAAATSVFGIIKLHYDFNADDSPERRAEVISHLRKLWQRVKESGRLEQYRQRQQERGIRASS